MTERNLSEIHTYMRKEIEKAGGKLSAIYFAPDIASKHNTLRKPQTGMGLQAKKDFPEIDFSKSIIVGDSMSDMEFGRKAGMKTVYIGNEAKTDDRIDFNFKGLIYFAHTLTQHK